MVAPEMGARSPGKEKRKRFFRCDLRIMSVPWCFKTCLEGLREEMDLAGESEINWLSRARVFNLFLCFDSASSLSFPPPPPPPFFDDEARTITATLLLLPLKLSGSSSSSPLMCLCQFNPEKKKEKKETF